MKLPARVHGSRFRPKALGFKGSGIRLWGAGLNSLGYDRDKHPLDEAIPAIIVI
jgi:hypothetical protein